MSLRHLIVLAFLCSLAGGGVAQDTVPEVIVPDPERMHYYSMARIGMAVREVQEKSRKRFAKRWDEGSPDFFKEQRSLARKCVQDPHLRSAHLRRYR